MLTTSTIALGTVVPGAGATHEDAYSIEAQALFSPTRTDLAVRVEGPRTPSVLEKVQVKAWPPGADEAETRNFFDVPSPDGVATIPLTGRARGDRLEVRVHLEVRPQDNLDAETTVLRRPDLTVTEIDVPDDVVRTRSFAVTAMLAEVGGDVGARATVELRDGATQVASAQVVVAPGASAPVTFPIVLAQPGEHTLHAIVTSSTPAEWDVAPNVRQHPLYVNHYDADGVVATDHPEATRVGVEVLRSGGNAFDAAAAVQFAVNVTQPHLSGIGGSSNIIVRDGQTGEVLAIDARETAPAATTAMTYNGLTVAQVGPNGYSVGVPGTLRAVEYMLDRWGTRSLADSLDPAIELAEEGFPAGFHLAFASGDARSRAFPETNAMFHRPGGGNLQLGDQIVQPDLAETLRLIAQDGVAAFYEGEIAQAIVAAQRRATTPGREGRMTLADLASYSIDVEQPLSLEYGGYDVVAPAPSTNGGVVLLESLGLIREFLSNPANAGYPWGFGTRNSLHVFIEAMRLAFADRDMWIGDERFSNVPASLVLDHDYLRDRSELIGRETVMCTPVLPGNPFAYEAVPADEASLEEGAGHTTHFSIIDRWGNAVVMTSTLADAWGSGIMVPGYGFLLNDSLTLFNRTPVANPVTGNPGANDAAGGKRPMGSMTPTLVRRDGEPVLGTGTHAAAFIPSIVLNVVLNVLEFDMTLQAAVEAPRFWAATPLAAAVNPGFASLIVPLRAMGHRGPAAGGCAGAVDPTPAGGTAIGSTGSFGVNLSDFGLTGGEDSGRFQDATTTVLTRN